MHLYAIVRGEAAGPHLGIFSTDCGVRFGYPFLVMDRHFLLQTLYDNIEDKFRIVPGKKVLKVEHSDEVVSVECKDGSTYTGDLVIGADGVHSIVRQEMWRHMDESGAGLLASTERTCKFEPQQIRIIPKYFQ